MLALNLLSIPFTNIMEYRFDMTYAYGRLRQRKLPTHHYRNAEFQTVLTALSTG